MRRKSMGILIFVQIFYIYENIERYEFSNPKICLNHPKWEIIISYREFSGK